MMLGSDTGASFVCCDFRPCLLLVVVTAHFSFMNSRAAELARRHWHIAWLLLTEPYIREFSSLAFALFYINQTQVGYIGASGHRVGPALTRSVSEWCSG